MSRCRAFSLLAIVFVWGLVACTSAPPANTVQARCEQQVYDDPAFKAVFVESSSRGMDPRYREQLAQARRKSINDCLAAQGLARRGGVEPVAGAHYGLGWFNTD
jgi:hypothetical protein